MSTDFDEVNGRIRGLVIALSGVLSANEAGEVEEFLEHAELGEALRTLAWIVVEEKKLIALADLMEMQLLADRLGITGELPEGLSDHVVDAK
ncbi:MAG TPA: hypothetical protein VFJ97_03735 [Dermatophilaceae bacterium]|nr:hypothetical protein [Dermatophilaceae bacterium]